MIVKAEASPARSQDAIDMGVSISIMYYIAYSRVSDPRVLIPLDPSPPVSAEAARRN